MSDEPKLHIEHKYHADRDVHEILIRGKNGTSLSSTYSRSGELVRVEASGMCPIRTAQYPHNATDEPAMIASKKTIAERFLRLFIQVCAENKEAIDPWRPDPDGYYWDVHPGQPFSGD